MIFEFVEFYICIIRVGWCTPYFKSDKSRMKLLEKGTAHQSYSLFRIFSNQFYYRKRKIDIIVAKCHVVLHHWTVLNIVNCSIQLTPATASSVIESRGIFGQSSIIHSKSSKKIDNLCINNNMYGLLSI